MNSRSTQPAPTRLSRRNIIAAVLAVIAAVFIVQNRNSTAIELFWVSVQAPLWLVLLAVLAIGWFVGVLTTRRSAKDNT